MARSAMMGSRIAGGLTAAACLAVLCVAAWLTPAAEGHGTHTQLVLRSGVGLQRCTWVALTGRPCPTCGMTTAFAHAAEGDFFASFAAQPMGAVLALATSLAFWAGLHTGVYGSSAGAMLCAGMGRRTLWGSLGLLALAWAYKIAVWPSP